jgi:murein DD-endopeptidase MepM/ murein hydrolase activator NlpD
VNWRKIKPGWYVLIVLLIYSVIMTVAFQQRSSTLTQLRRNASMLAATTGEGDVSDNATPTANAPAGLWFPIAGASVPRSEAYLPGAPRVYRNGVNQGFDFYSNDAGIPIPYGTPVVASAGGVISRADNNYSELDQAAWDALLEEVEVNGATEEQLDRLRGRQIWLTTDDGRTLRYAHLSRIRPGIEEGQRVYRGQVIGFVGNSGTDDGVRGTSGGARLHFEIWQDEQFFGQEMDSEELRVRAASLFVGP